MRSIFNLLVFFVLVKFSFASQLINIVSHQEASEQIIKFQFSESSQKPTIMKIGSDLIVDILNVKSIDNHYNFENSYISKVLLASDHNKLRILLKDGAKFTYDYKQTAKEFRLIFLQKSNQQIIQNNHRNFINNTKNLQIVKDIKFKVDDSLGGIITINYASSNGVIKIKE